MLTFAAVTIASPPTPPPRFGTLAYALVSPVLLVAVCAGVQLAAGLVIGVWAWVPTMLCFWLAIAVVVRGFSGSAAAARRRFRPACGGVAWSGLAVCGGLLSLPGFLAHREVLDEPAVVISWLVFALVNPWFEESYWRGLLLDATATWGRLPSLAYSAVWFAASHPLVWGIHADALRKPEAAGALVFVGLLWGLAYQRTGTLRWCVVGHALANLLGLAAPVLLNLYDPTAH